MSRAQEEKEDRERAARIAAKQADEIKRAATTADIMTRLERVGAEATRALRPIIEREGMGVVVIVVDPDAPRDITAIAGAGNMTVTSQRDACAAYVRMMDRAGPEARKVPL